MARYLIITVFTLVISLAAYFLWPRSKPGPESVDIEMAQTQLGLIRITELLWEIQGENPVGRGGPPYDPNGVMLSGACGGEDAPRVIAEINKEE